MMRIASPLLGLVLGGAVVASACTVHVRDRGMKGDEGRLTLSARVDSFAMLVGERRVGAMVMTMEREGDEWRLTETTSSGRGMGQRTEARLTKAGAVRRVHQVASTRDGADTIDIQYRDGKVSGRVSTRSNGTQVASELSQDVPAGTWDDNTAFPLLSSLGGVRTARTQSVFSAGTRTLYTWRVEPGEVETIDVPAGRFSARRVQLSGGQVPVTFWFENNSPFRVLRIAPTGSPLRFDRVR